MSTDTRLDAPRSDRRQNDRRESAAAYASDDRREAERRSGQDRRQAPRVRFNP